MTTQNLNKIIDVSVVVSASAAARATFNEGLIVGPCVVGTQQIIGPSERLRSYTDVDDMLTDGFTVDSPEYLAAVKYFEQDPAPLTVWIGVRDTLTSPNESVLDAILACREADSDWYMVYSVEAVAEDILDIAPEVEVMVPSSAFIADSSDADILVANPISPDVATELKSNSYKRTMLIYSTSQFIGAGIMGVACGLNNGLANSAFALFAKQIVGCVVENLTSNQVAIVEGKNCNLYLNYANFYNIFEQGVMSNGSFFDQIVNRDMLVNDVQLSCMDLIYANRKIPQTDPGMGAIHNAIVSACQAAVNRGHLGAGTYTGVSFLNLHTGDAMPNGYVIQSGSLSDQSIADRDARKAVPFYVTIKESGAVQSVNIEVIVNV